jgi:hypothetical protein
MNLLVKLHLGSLGMIFVMLFLVILGSAPYNVLFVLFIFVFWVNVPNPFFYVESGRVASECNFLRRGGV